jgi:hypothetical protein
MIVKEINEIQMVIYRDAEKYKAKLQKVKEMNRNVMKNNGGKTKHGPFNDDQ